MSFACKVYATKKDTPIGIDNSALFFPDVFVVPVPSLWIDWLSDGAENTESSQIATFNVVFTVTTEETNSSRSRVELGELVFLDSFPVSRRCGINWSRLEDAKVGGVSGG